MYRPRIIEIKNEPFLHIPQAYSSECENYITKNKDSFATHLYDFYNRVEHLFYCDVILVHYLKKVSSITQEEYKSVLCIDLRKLKLQWSVVHTHMNDIHQVSHLTLITTEDMECEEFDFLFAYFEHQMVKEEIHIYIPVYLINNLFFRVS